MPRNETKAYLSADTVVRTTLCSPSKAVINIDDDICALQLTIAPAVIDRLLTALLVARKSIDGQRSLLDGPDHAREMRLAEAERLEAIEALN